MPRERRVFNTEVASFCGYLGGVVVVILVELSVCSMLSFVFRSHEESVRIGDRIQYPIMTIKFNWDGQITLNIVDQAPRSIATDQLPYSFSARSGIQR